MSVIGLVQSYREGSIPSAIMSEIFISIG